ncbi:helix-turn-helix domain-containing protein [Flavobacterium crassostreae]|uniref:DNA-binding protein n=1 Tax=Flavobacterium crassostreae TaxID=1763534 RepID=A0A1B9E7P6_9FLAO|nr:XRE family transcriptional regulator [Flavobacterium crassostreae]OCB77972.1 DNA-binding protein [Flavobacterium crassostreae]
MGFNYRQLIFAREYRGLTQSELAKNIVGLSQSNLSKYEKGFGLLSDEMVLKIIDFLGFPESWLDHNISNLPENAHYRKRTTITKKIKTEIEYSIRLIGYLVDQMSNSIEWPEVRLVPLDIEEGYTPEIIAKNTRKLLRILPNEPVKSIFTLLENFGIIVIEFEITEKFDGVSFITDKGNPVIILNKSFTNDRKRFTLAHELGHLMMHDFPIPYHRNIEKIKENEANRFASEFLMPAEFIKNSLFNLKLSSLGQLKSYWLTSMASIIRRAKDLSCISESHFTYLTIELSRDGKKKNEDGFVFIDEPSLFIEAYKLHKNELDYSDLELSNAFNIPVDVIQRFFNTSRLRIIK